MFNIVQSPVSNGTFGILDLPEFIISATKKLSAQVNVYDGQEYRTLVDLGYTPGVDGMVEFDIRDIIASELETVFQLSSHNYIQRSFKAAISVALSDDDMNASLTFNVVNVRCKTPSLSNILMHKFLTIQPSVKYTRRRAPEYLTYSYYRESTLKVKFYLESGGTEIVTLYTCSNDFVTRTHNVSFAKLLQLASPAAKKSYYDIYVENGNGTRRSNIQRYVVKDDTGREKYYLFANQMGGIDTLICCGQLTSKPDAEYNIGRLSIGLVQLDDSEDTLTYTQNSGMMMTAFNSWIEDFLMSKKAKYVYEAGNNTFTKIVVIDNDYTFNDRDSLVAFSFSYKKAEGDFLYIDGEIGMLQQDLTVTSNVIMI